MILSHVDVFRLKITPLIPTVGIEPVKPKKLAQNCDYFLCISLRMFWCSKDPSHRDGYFEYPQHMFWLRNKKNIQFLLSAGLYRQKVHLSRDMRFPTTCHIDIDADEPVQPPFKLRNRE